MSEKKKVAIVNLITGTRFIGALLLPLIVSIFGPLGTAIYIGALWVSDAVDGYLAKKRWHVSTIFGASLDAFCDKVLGVATLGYLYSFYPFMLISLITELAIFGVNFYYGKKGADVKSSKLGKFKSGVLYISTVLAILSTLSLTSSLAAIIPLLMTVTTAVQLVTLSDYVKKNKNYLKKHKPKKDVSKLGFIKTIKEIFRLLKDPKLYSPAYFKEHNGETLLDMLYNEEDTKTIEVSEEIKSDTEIATNENDESILSISEKNEFKILYNLTNKEVDKIEQYMLIHNISKEDMKMFIESYINTVNTNYRNANKIEEFIQKEIKKTKNK